MRQVELYDAGLCFQSNRAHGPFGGYADPEPYVNPGEPQFDFFGTPVYSPFGIGAGPLPTPPFIRAALDRGYDIVTIKSVRTEEFPLHRFPHVRPVARRGDLDPESGTPIVVAERYKAPLAVANSFGIPSAAPGVWQPEVAGMLQMARPGQVVLPAFQGTARGRGKEEFVQDHVRGVGLLKAVGASVVEVNLSCPNEGESVLACHDTDITTRIVEAVREAHADVKLIYKLAYFKNAVQLRNLISRIGGLVDGIAAINTIPARVVDTSGRDAFPGRPMAGISGEPIKWAGLEMTRRLHAYRSELGHSFKIISLGGVSTADAFHEYRAAGADTVMSVTGAMWNPNLAAEVKTLL